MVDRIKVLLVLLILATGASPFAAPAPSPRKIEGSENVFAIYIDHGGKYSLICCLWRDGYCVTSRENTRGGQPYEARYIDRDSASAFFDFLAKSGVLDCRGLSGILLHKSHTVVYAERNGKQLKMASAHEIMEAEADRAMLEIGLVGLKNSEKLYRVLENESKQYLFSRFLWAELRFRLSTLAKGGGRKVKGQIVADGRGKLLWQENR